MDPTRIAIGAAAIFVTLVVMTLGLMFAGMQVILAMDVDVPKREELDGVGPSMVYDRDGELLARFTADVEHEPVELDEIAPSLRDAVVAKEDRRFWEHEGVDVFSALRAVWRNVTTGRIAEGGSTLTQQFVKNVYLDADQTYSRKIEEALIAMRLERQYSKEEILNDYLNQVYFGDGAYGAEAAARAYFDKPAADLELHESATLASVLSAPSRLSPRNDPHMFVVRRNRLIEYMAEHDFITQEEASEALDAETVIEPRPDSVLAAPYFVEEVRRQAVEAYGDDRVYRGRLEITTTLDLDLHGLLRERVEEMLPDDPAVDAGVVALDPRTGDVLAAYSGRDYEESQVNLAMRFGRPSGSTFKPIVLATALEQGRELSSTYPAPSRTTIGDWTVRGGGCGGRCTLRAATVHSINTAFANVANDVGTRSFTTMAQRLGMRAEFVDHDLTQALGTASISPLDLTSAFATFANEGVACPARTVMQVTGHDGDEIDPPDPRQPSEEQLEEWTDLREGLTGRARTRPDHPDRCHRAIDAKVAFDVNEALQLAVSEGTGGNAQIEDLDQAGKTGTSDDSREIWFAGYNPNLAMGVFIGRRDDNRSLVNLEGCNGQCFGGDTAALTWGHAAEALFERYPPGEFPDEPPDERRLLPTPSPATTTPETSPSPSAPSSATPAPAPSPSPPSEPSPEQDREPSPDPDDGDDEPNDEYDPGDYDEDQYGTEPDDEVEDDPEDEQDDDDGGGGSGVPSLP